MKNWQKMTLVLSAAALMLTACGQKKKQEQVAQGQDVRVVKLEKVTKESVADRQEYTATVESEVKNNIAPAAPTRINRIRVEVGDRVARGQVLVEMDVTNLKQQELQLANMKTEYSRMEELFKIGGISKSEWEAYQTKYGVQKAAMENLKTNTTLRSPISGVVTARNYDNGDMYAGATPILTIEQINPVKLLINVSETYFTKIKVGDPVQVKLDVYGDETFQGKVSLIHPTVDSATRTFAVEVKLNNADGRVRPGMFARATVNFGAAEHVVVPDRAIIKQIGSGDRYVYVCEDGKVTYRKVTLGQRLGNRYELLDGVEDGEQVVVAGQTALVDGAAVKVE